MTTPDVRITTAADVRPTTNGSRENLVRIVRSRIAHRESVVQQMYALMAAHESRGPLREFYRNCAASAAARAASHRVGQVYRNSMIELVAILLAPYLGFRFVCRYERETARLKFGLLALGQERSRGGVSAPRRRNADILSCLA